MNLTPLPAPMRDYSSFTAAAKSRFRPIADALGYKQISGILYARRTVGGWHEMFGLQAAQHGNDFFYVNFGIVVDDLCPVVPPTPLGSCGLLISSQLRDVDDTGGFGREDKQAIAASAARVLEQYRKLARPWFDEMPTWDAIAAEYLRINSIEEEKLGRHCVDFGADFRSAIYGWLLLKCKRVADAVRWLREAERLLALPIYHTRDGRTVHEPEKGARLQKPEPHAIEMLLQVRETLALIGTET